jgi:single-stranded-DNA-specific exonuclease
MKERHIRLELRQDSLASAAATGGASMRCVGWDWAERCLQMGLAAGSDVDVAYRIRENDHPEYGGIEIELIGIRPAET